MKGSAVDANAADFRPPTMYYTTIPLVAERQQNRRWDASKLRDLRKRLDSGGMTGEEVDEVAKDFVDGEIVDLASDWLGNTVSNIPLHFIRHVVNAHIHFRLYKNYSRNALMAQDWPCWSASCLISRRLASTRTVPGLRRK